MAKITLDGVTLAYEILGQGPPVVWTPGGFEDKERARPLAERLSSRYRVLIYDRPNCGASDVVIEGAPSELVVWANYLHALMEQLGMSPAYVGGGSGGHIPSLLVAHRHPEDVKALLLVAPSTDNLELWEFLRLRYREGAELSETKGMQAVIEISPWAELIKQNPANRERLLSMDPKRFAAIMRQWSKFAESGRPYFAHLSDDELQRITVPAIIIPGIEEYHPRHVAERLHGLLPNSELVLPDDILSSAEIERLRKLIGEGQGNQFDAALAPILDNFMQKAEAERS
jgi:pimeloyl-ACP methyl ester carboxylesterase